MTTILLPIALLLLFVSIVLLAFSLLPGGRGTAVRGMAFRQAELERLPGYLRLLVSAARRSLAAREADPVGRRIARTRRRSCSERASPKR